MAEIIPAILAYNAKDFNQKLNLMKHDARLIQIDIADGKFVRGKSYAPKKITSGRKKFEIHLMVKNPMRHVRDWIAHGTRRLVVHKEALLNDEFIQIRDLCRRAQVTLGISLNPKTSISRVRSWINMIHFVQIMGVDPGRQGAPFHASTYQKIKDLKKVAPKIPIQIDGGVTLKNLRPLMRAGATRFVVGSAIFKSKNPKKMLKTLRAAARARV